jgi:hypothetical protein
MHPGGEVVVISLPVCTIVEIANRQRKPMSGFVGKQESNFQSVGLERWDCSSDHNQSFLHPTPRELVIPVQRGTGHEGHGTAFAEASHGRGGVLNISKRATDPQKRELFARLAQHLNVLASEVARAMSAKKSRRRLLGAWRSHFLVEA